MSLTILEHGTVYLVESFSFFEVHEIMVFIGGVLHLIEYSSFDEYFRLWNFIPFFLYLWLFNFLSKLLF